MTNPIVFKEYTLTKEEAELLLNTLKETRAEKAKQQAYKANKNFLYEPRGFNTIEEHDRAIIKNWNEIVKPDDDGEVYDKVYEFNETDEKTLRSLMKAVYAQVLNLNYDIL